MDLAIEQTLCIIKPDACRAQKHKEIMQLIELEGFHILERRLILLSEAHVRDFYSEHIEKPFFSKLQSFMTSGTIWALVLAKNDAISAWRSMMGPTDSIAAKAVAPGTMRALYGTDSPTSAQREIKFFFPHRTAARAPAAPGGKVKLQSSLEGALCKGLAILARDKPAEDTMTALAWLGDWLLENNPLKPKIVASNDLNLIEVDDGSDFAPSVGAQEMAHGSTDAAETIEDDGGVQRTLAMIKPDAVGAGATQAIISRIEAAGFTVTKRRQYTLYPAQAEQFYAEHAGKPFFSKLIDFMTSGPIWALELQATGAVKGWRTLMGPTNTLNAQLEAPDSIRAKFGTDGTRNATHGSDSVASAERELAFHFPPQQKTLAMIKPDAVAAGAAQRIKAQIEAQGLKIIRQREYQMTKEQAESFYSEHSGKAFYSKLVAFMTSGPIWALELEGQGAIAGWRAMMGPTDSSKAKASAPSTLRACFGTDGTKNAVHGSDSPASAEREIAFHFSSKLADSTSSPAAVPASAAPDSTLQESLAPDSAQTEAQPQAENVETVVVTPEDSSIPTEEEEAAAVAVQSAVRGHQARQQAKRLKQSKSGIQVSPTEPAEELPATSEGAEASTEEPTATEVDQDPTDASQDNVEEVVAAEVVDPVASEQSADKGEQLAGGEAQMVQDQEPAAVADPTEPPVEPNSGETKEVTESPAELTPDEPTAPPAEADPQE